MLANSGKVRIFAPVKTKQWSRSWASQKRARQSALERRREECADR